LLALAALAFAGLQAPSAPLFSMAAACAQPAAPSADDKRAAAASFDLGVSRFNRAEFEEAAQAFFEAGTQLAGHHQRHRRGAEGQRSPARGPRRAAGHRP
jgi:hypothetical protein